MLQLSVALTNIYQRFNLICYYTTWLLSCLYLPAPHIVIGDQRERGCFGGKGKEGDPRHHLNRSSWASNTANGTFATLTCGSRSVQSVFMHRVAMKISSPRPHIGSRASGCFNFFFLVTKKWKRHHSTSKISSPTAPFLPFKRRAFCGYMLDNGAGCVRCAHVLLTAVPF